MASAITRDMRNIVSEMIDIIPPTCRFMAQPNEFVLINSAGLWEREKIVEYEKAPRAAAAAIFPHKPSRLVGLVPMDGGQLVAVRCKGRLMNSPEGKFEYGNRRKNAAQRRGTGVLGP